MGILWWRNKAKSAETTKQETEKSKGGEVAEGMNGAMEVQRLPKEEVTVFEFGSIATSTDKVTLAGFCPVSEQLEPCRWEILPALDSSDPQFRIVF